MIVRAFFILIFFLAATVSAADFFGGGKTHAGARPPRAPGIASESTASSDNPFYAIPIEARAAYVFDERTGSVLYEKDAELQLPLASLAKVMAVLVAREIAPDATITISADAIAAEGDSGLLLHEKWQIRDLADFTLVTSSNDGARALASASAAFVQSEQKEQRTVFVDLMNEKARALGMEQTFFVNETGLDEGHGVSGAYGSARNVATLFVYALRTYPELFSATTRDTSTISSLDATHTATNTNIIAKKIPGLIASKTGFTDLAGGNLAVAFEAGPLRPIIVVVLGSTAEGRFADIERLVRASSIAIAAGR